MNSTDILTHINMGNDFCLDRKTGLHYHPGVTMALSEEIPSVRSKDGFWFTQKDINSNWKKFQFDTSASIPDHISNFSND